MGAEVAAGAVLIETAALQSLTPAELLAWSWQLYSVNGCKSATMAHLITLCHAAVAVPNTGNKLGWSCCIVEVWPTAYVQT